MKLKYLLLIVVLLSINNMYSQSIKLIPNPDTTNTGFAGSWLKVFNNKLYTTYKNQNGDFQLAEYNGNTIKLYANPDTTGTILNYSTTTYISYVPIILNGNMLLTYKNKSGKLQLVKFDGNTLSLINNPDKGNGINSFFYKSTYLIPDSGTSIYKSNLYFSYLDSIGTNQLACYNGLSVSLIKPSNSKLSFDRYSNNAQIFNDTLYCIFTNTTTKINFLAKYDGATLTIINNPDSGGGVYNKLSMFNNDIYFLYYSLNYPQLAKYDGNKITVFTDSSGNGWYSTKYYDPVVYNNAIYYFGGNDNLEKCNVNNTTSINNVPKLNNIPERIAYMLTPTVWNNKLFFCIADSSNQKANLGYYDGNNITIINNPDNGPGFGFNKGNSSNYISSYNINFVNYNNSIFTIYTNASNNKVLVNYNGNITNFIKSSDTSLELINPKLVNDSLFILAINKSGMYQIAEYKDSILKVYSNPDNGSIASYPVFYNGNKYLIYSTSSGKYNLAIMESINNAIVTGRIATPKHNTIMGVIIKYRGSSNGTKLADSTGVFDLGLSIGNYVILPTKNNDINKANGVTAIDIALTQAHILGKNLLNSPYKLIAADVSGDGKITALDIVYMKRLILGIDTTFTNSVTKQNRLWAFVDSSYKFADSTNPFPFKDSISYTNLNANKINQTFIGIKLGDVNWDWNPALARSINYNKELPLPLPVSDSLFINRNKGIMLNRQRRK